MTPVEHAVAALFAPVGLAAFRRDVRGRQPMHREPSTGRLAAFHALASWSIDDLLAGHRGDATAWSERGNRTLNHALHLVAMCHRRALVRSPRSVSAHPRLVVGRGAKRPLGRVGSDRRAGPVHRNERRERAKLIRKGRDPGPLPVRRTIWTYADGLTPTVSEAEIRSVTYALIEDFKDGTYLMRDANGDVKRVQLLL